MSNNKPIFGMAEQRKVEEHGFSILKEDKIKCENCKKLLLDIVKYKEDKEINTAIRVECPYCGSMSFWYRISGRIGIQAHEGLSVEDMPVNIRNNVRFTNIRLIKNGS